MNAVELIPVQENTELEESADRRKYEIDRLLTFRSYDPDEVACLGEDHKYTFRRGDVLKVLPRNGCGMGIDVVRLSDGKTDMVWPTEVTVRKPEPSSRSRPCRVL